MSVSKIKKKLDENQRKTKGMTSEISSEEDMENISFVSRM